MAILMSRDSHEPKPQLWANHTIYANSPSCINSALFLHNSTVSPSTWATLYWAIFFWIDIILILILRHLALYQRPPPSPRTSQSTSSPAKAPRLFLTLAFWKAWFAYPPTALNTPRSPSDTLRAAAKRFLLGTLAMAILSTLVLIHALSLQNYRYCMPEWAAWSGGVHGNLVFEWLCLGALLYFASVGVVSYISLVRDLWGPRSWPTAVKLHEGLLVWPVVALVSAVLGIFVVAPLFALGVGVVVVGRPVVGCVVGCVRNCCAGGWREDDGEEMSGSVTRVVKRVQPRMEVDLEDGRTLCGSVDGGVRSLEKVVLKD